MPVPDRATSVEVAVAVETIASAAVLAPTDVGAKVTFLVQLCVGVSVSGNVVPQVPPARVNMAASVPAAAIELMTRSAVPVFVMVTVWAEDV
jgi:hypothetical protein